RRSSRTTSTRWCPRESPSSRPRRVCGRARPKSCGRAEQGLRAAREMARAGVDIIVLGGVPVNLAAGYASVGELAKKVQDECGVPVTASLLCQNHALQAVGASKVVVLRPGAGGHDRHTQEIERLGCTILDVRGTGSAMYGTPLSAQDTLEMARA